MSNKKEVQILFNSFFQIQDQLHRLLDERDAYREIATRAQMAYLQQLGETPDRDCALTDVDSYAEIYLAERQRARRDGRRQKTTDT